MLRVYHHKNVKFSLSYRTFDRLLVFLEKKDLMKKLLYLVILLGLCAMSYFFVFKKSTTTFDKQATAFSIANPDVIDKVIITEHDGQKAELIKQASDKWAINGRYYARPDAMNVMFNTLKRVRVNYPLPQSAEENVKEDFEKRPKKVEIFSEGKRLKSILMSGYTNDQKGTYMRLEDNDQIYVTHLPGFDGYLQRRFFTNIEEWRTREAFDFAKDDIQKVRIDYYEEPKKSFEIQAKDLQVTSPKSVAQKGQVNSIFATAFLKSFENVNVEAFKNDFSIKDSILQQTPICKITVTPNNDQQKDITIYRAFLTERSKQMFDDKGNPLKYDADRYYAILNEGRDFAVIQDYVFGKLMKSYGDFWVQ